MNNREFIDRAVFWGILIIAFAIPLLGGTAGRNIKYLWAAVGVLWILRGNISLKGPLFLPLCMFAMVTVLSALTGVNPGRSFRFIVREDVNFLLLFIVAGCVRDKKHFDLIVRVFLLSAAAVCFLAVLQYVFQRSSFVQKILGYAGAGGLTGGRADTTRAHPLILADNLCLYIPLAAAFLASAKKRMFPALCLVVMISTLIFTYSRGPAIYLGVVFIMASVLFFRKLKWLILTTVLTIFLAVSIVSITKGLSIKRRLNLDSGGRIKLWKSALLMIKDRTLFGVGPGNVISVYEKSYRKDRIHFYHLHNTFIHITAERGIFALGIYLWIIFIFFRSLYRRVRIFGSGDEQGIILTGLMFGFAAYTLAGLTDYTFYRSEMYFPFYFLAGLAMSKDAAGNGWGYGYKVR
ncbi:MAG: O-antigen ligase family protein [Elusimicrobiota bacterium]